MTQPLILTLQLDLEAQAFYEELRQRYFPAERNLIPAHLTLFHHLPDEAFTLDTLTSAAYVSASFRLRNPTLRSIGRGVAVFFRCEAAVALYAALSSAFDAALIAQDRQRFQPHIVIQNKVTGDVARQTLAGLQSVPMVEPRAIGLTLWRYLGGPWEHLADLSFAGSSDAS